MRLAEDVLRDPAPAAGGPRGHGPGALRPGTRGGDSPHPSLAGVLTGELAPGPRRSPFDAEVGCERAVAFAVTSMSAPHEAAGRLAGATVDDAVLAVVAGALCRWLEHRHRAIHGLSLKVPVTLPTDRARVRGWWRRTPSGGGHAGSLESVTIDGSASGRAQTGKRRAGGRARAGRSLGSAGPRQP